MKVCFVSHSAAKGGAERALLELLETLKDRGVECYVLLPSDGPLRDDLRVLGVDHYVLPYKRWMSKNSPLWKRIGRIVINLAMIIPVAVKIKKWGCEVVYTNTITECIGAFVAFLLRRPHVWHIHEFGYEHHRLIYDLGEKLSLWLMDKLSAVCIANSHVVAQKYMKYIPLEKLKTVYQSVSVKPQALDNQVFPMIERGAKSEIKCIIVGALSEGKRQEDAIRAIDVLVRYKGIKASLLIVGDGDPKYREYLHNLVTENHLNEYVAFAGYVENPFPLIQASDVLLMCSENEAFGRVTIEGMMAGKPVIGARSGGTAELIHDGFNGFLYSLKDYKELAEKIYYLFEHPSDMRLMGENAKKWAENRFTKDRYGKEVLNILVELVRKY